MDNNGNNKELKVTFYSGVGTATGANFMAEFGSKKILIDCGLLQGIKEQENINFEKFAYDPSLVDYLFITHAHMDHIGRVPKLVAEGFKGKIISTRETMDLARPALEDAFRVMKHKFPNEEMYKENDIDIAFSFWYGESYYKKIDIDGVFSYEFFNAGHILGSSIIIFSFGDKKVAFTGDLGNSPSPLLPDTDFIKDIDYMVIESVYGDRNHEDREDRRGELKRIILDGIKRGGTIIMPAFSIERTQVLLYELNNMIEDGEVPSVPVYLDSPLASKVTKIYDKYQNDFREEVRKEIKTGDDIFSFPKLSIIEDKRDSEGLTKDKGIKIIMAGSGMSEGGRMMAHETNFLPDEKDTLLLVGYQAYGTLGRRLLDGAKEVRIGQNVVPVRAKVESIMGYSSHKDSDGLLEFVEKASEDKRLKKVFVCMGEPKSSLFLAQRIKDYVGVEAMYPEIKKTYVL